MPTFFLIQDGGTQVNLTHTKRQIFHWNRRLNHIGIENLKALTYQGLLQQEIANDSVPVCTFCAQGKKNSASTRKMRLGIQSNK